MLHTKDIIERIEQDFGNKASEVVNIFDHTISKAEHLNNDRIIRCILFLSGKDIEKLKKNIEAATLDPRDVMLWAEYEQHQSANPKRVRDFSKAF